MSFYASRENFDMSVTHPFKFKALADKRADILHSRTVEVDDQLVVAAKNLLVAMLKRELRIDAPVPWEQLPQISVLYHRYKFADMGYRDPADAKPSAGESDPAKT